MSSCEEVRAFKRKEAGAFGAQRARERVKQEWWLGQSPQDEDGHGESLVFIFKAIGSLV